MFQQIDRVPFTASAPVPFGASFVRSESFKVLFRDGMGLIEETAAYLDGDGRTESARLGRGASLNYASESMRLTTRLMQIASWLLVQRALSEGEITSGQADREKDRVKLVAQEQLLGEGEFTVLPERLRDLVAQSRRLHDRVMHLDTLMADAAAPRPCPVSRQHELLSLAFAAR